jgi:asparagine synthase (glutamine-hydrolysing)
MRRLSIIDVEGGRQPMANENGSVVVVANGELYSSPELREELTAAGHVFGTRSDIEVIVHGYEEWGLEGLLSRLNGMFAFALHDTHRDVTYLARDRLGIKPLVYARRGSELLFASGLSGLLASGRLDVLPDPIGVRLFLHNQFTPAQYTVVRGVEKLPPASYIEISADRVGAPVRYWRIPGEIDGRRTTEEWIEEMRALVEDAVRVHLLSDVEVGAFLSGGIDSSVVVGLMARHTNRPPKAFSVGVEGDDETPHAYAAAKRFGVDFHHLVFAPTQVVDVVDDVAAVMEEPIADPAVLPTLLLASEARRHVKVVLTGEGGDELFAGYGYYERLRSPWRQAQSAVRRALARSVASRRMGYRHRSFWSGYPYVMRPGSVERFLRDLPGGDAGKTAAIVDATERSFATDGLDGLSRALRVDAQTWLPEDLLMKVDRATMAFSLEARVPLLDYRVVEFASRIPAGLKMCRQVGKWIFRSAFRELIGPELADRGKMGFGVPMGRWIRGQLRPLLDECLSRSSLAHTPWLDADAIDMYGRSACWPGGSERPANARRERRFRFLCGTAVGIMGSSPGALPGLARRFPISGAEAKHGNAREIEASLGGCCRPGARGVRGPAGFLSGGFSGRSVREAGPAHGVHPGQPLGLGQRRNERTAFPVRRADGETHAGDAG